MKYQVVSVRDRSGDVFAQPVFVQSIGSAIRSFSDEVNRAAENNILYQHPEDFDLYHLGEYDDQLGLFQCGVPKQIAVGKDLRLPDAGKLRAVN